MKRLDVAFIVIGSFFLFHYIIPFILGLYYGESIYWYSIFRFLSVVSIPIIMYFTFDISQIWEIRATAITLFLIAVSFLFMDMGLGSILTFFIVMIGTFFLFSVGLTLRPAHNVLFRVGLFMVISSMMLVLRYSSISNIIYTVIKDYNDATVQNWNMDLILYIILEVIYVMFFISQYLTLDGILIERRKYHV